MAQRVLLHTCCGPCALFPVRALRDEGYVVTGLFYNPNIHPLSEYLRRREAMARAAEEMGLDMIWMDKDYEPQRWFRRVAEREQNRCHYCYAMRLERAAQVAARGGFDHVTSTLLYSRKQKHEHIAELGRDAAAGRKTAFLYRDFREGWSEGIEQSKEMGLYRQQYCGCLYSENERYYKDLRALTESC